MKRYLAGTTVTTAIFALILAIAEQRGCTLPPLPNIITPPSPVASDALRVLIVEESSARSRLPMGQLAVLTSVPLRQWLAAHNATWRMVDANDSPSDLDATMQTMFARQRASLPWLIVCGPYGGAEGPLPDSPDAAIAALEQFTGVKP